MNADQLVFSTAEDKHVRRLIRNHRRFAVTVEHVKMPTPDGYLAASTMVVRQRR